MPELETITVEKPYLELDCILGEGPYYEETGELRFVDIVKKRIHSVDLRQGPDSHKVTQLDDCVGVTADIKGRDGEYVVAAKRGYAIFNKATGKLYYIKKIYEDDPAKAERMRFNDGAVDSKGRFWAGSMNDFHVGQPQPEGTVFRLDADLTLHRMIEGVTIPNGMGWSLDDKTMYVTDSPTKCIFAYDYDSESGSISNKRVFFRLESDKQDEVPDGCTIDSAGHLWVASHGGGRLLRISPEGKLVAQVCLPNSRPTCPRFAGPELKELLVTSAGFGEEEKPQASSYDGSVFRVLTGASGSRPNKFVLAS